ncbi:MAG: baseplate assembly protein [Janthinobacterium lividum]
MSSTPIDLSRLPAPDVIETIDFETLLEQRKARLVELYPEADQDAVSAALRMESEPMSILLQENAYREMVLRQRVNDAARSVMLAYATRKDLEHLAALFDIERLTLSPADHERNIAAVYESDDALRKRTQLAPRGFSVAGPEAAYVSHALNTDAHVLDATAISPAPCEVLVTILSRDGDGTASRELIDAVTAALQADDVRPLTDRVTVQGAEIIKYSVEAAITTFPGPDASVVLNEARSRLFHYVESVRRLGREVTLSGIYAALHVDGVERVTIESPQGNLRISRSQAPYCDGVWISHAGVYGQ